MSRKAGSAAFTHAAAGSFRRLMSSSTRPKTPAGYEAFGSFHSASPDALFAGAAFQVAPPPASLFPPLPSRKLETRVSDAAAETANRAHFTVDFDAWTYLNHGAFGGATRFASDVAAGWRTLADRQPLLFHDRELFPFIVQAVTALAAFVGVRDPKQLVLLPNATSGLHAVLHSVLTTALNKESAEDDNDDRVVICFSTRYGAVRKMLQAIETESQNASRRLRILEVPLSLADSYDDAIVVRKLEAALTSASSQVALVVVDHITSNTGVQLPVEALTTLCHAHNAPVLIDGAHALLNLPLDVDAIGADYYVGNCHKWFCSPRGAGFLHVHSRNPVAVRPRVVSHGYNDGFQSAFMWLGLQDYSPWLTLTHCIAYWEHQGVADCRTYMHTLAQAAVERLYTTWGMADDLAAAQHFPMHKRHAMRLVRLPPSSVFGVDTSGTALMTSAHAKFVQDTLHHAHAIEVPIKCVDGALYARVSAHMYNSLADYDRLAQAVQSHSA